MKLPLEALELKMEKSVSIRRAVESDLGLNIPYIKGQNIPVKNCWHFSTDGNQVDFLFRDDEDFIAGTNRLFLLSRKYRVIILAYNLMDTHVHIILWGLLEDCQKFMHEFLRVTSMSISKKYGDRHKLNKVPPNYQTITDDRYLKTAICYVLKNAPVAGIAFNALDYPWSSGPLYFKRKGYWTFSGWEPILTDSRTLSSQEICRILRTRYVPSFPFKLIGDMVFPGEFVATDIVERLFKTHKGFHFFMCFSKESDVESVKGSISRLSIPNTELHQHKNELCREKFGVDTIRSLSTGQRLSLAKMLKASYNCSPKQIAKACGLIFSEVKNML